MFNWVTSLIDSVGYGGVFAGMFLENIFPPLPSELVMIFSGATAANTDLNIFLVIIVGALGSTVGLLPWYYLARSMGEEKIVHFVRRYGRWLAITPKDLRKAHHYFERYKEKLLFTGRFMPAVRTLVAIPAGILKVRVHTVLIFGFLGTLIWDAILACIGFFIGNNAEPIVHIIDIVTYVIFGALILWYVYRVITFHKKS